MSERIKLKNKFHYRTYLVNGAYIAILDVIGIKGGYSAWGLTREEAVRNVCNYAGNYVKEL